MDSARNQQNIANKLNILEFINNIYYKIINIHTHNENDSGTNLHLLFCGHVRPVAHSREDILYHPHSPVSYCCSVRSWKINTDQGQMKARPYQKINTDQGQMKARPYQKPVGHLLSSRSTGTIPSYVKTMKENALTTILTTTCYNSVLDKNNIIVISYLQFMSTLSAISAISMRYSIQS